MKTDIEIVQYLYSTMPGAEKPPIEDGKYMWGDVANTKHWEFCEALVNIIDRRTNGP
jgi:hypothetical protein